MELVFAREFDRIDEAFALEKRVQGWSRAKREALIDGRLDDLPTLSGIVRIRRTPLISTGSISGAGSLVP